MLHWAPSVNSGGALSFLDQVLTMTEQCLLAIHRPVRPQTVDQQLSTQERQEVGRLMRINHVGEVCAQGLYLGAECAAKSTKVAKMMNESRQEEIPHMQWLERRLAQLEGRVSYGLPAWFSASWVLGYVAGLAGDQWSLGFVAETEKQVVLHLEDHLSRLPKHDTESHRVLIKILNEELAHQHEAEEMGARQLPNGIQSAMALAAEGMRRVVRWL